MTSSARGARSLTATAMAHVQTWRPYTLWYVGFLGLAGAALSDGSHSGWRLLAAWATPTLGWLGGHYLSDYFDRHLDGIAKPHRPIPSGRLPASMALSCGVLSMLAVAVLAVVTGWRTSLVAVLAVAAVLSYGLRLKALGLAGNLVRGALGALALLYGAVIVAPPHWTLVPFLLAFLLHDTASNLVGTLRDIDGDRAGGYRTLPVSHGSVVGVWTAAGLYAGAIAAAAIGASAGATGSGRLWYLGCLACVAVLGARALAPLIPQRRLLPVRVALHAHEVLVLERLALAAAVIGLGLGIVPALALLVPAWMFTWWTQRRLRAAYELGTDPPVPSAAATPDPRPKGSTYA